MVPYASLSKAQVPHIKVYEQSLNSAALELKYEQSTHLVDTIAKDEDIRRMRFEIHVLGDDNDELRELLAHEEDRSDTFEKLVNENLARAEAAEQRLQDNEAELRVREQEFGTLHAETKALQTTAADSETFLTEKLALTRELSMLRPELDHLKTQVASTEALMAEKLELQRQLSNIQCELENAKRDTKRALAKRRNTGVEIAQEVEVENLRRELAKEKRARQRAEEAADVTQADVNIDEVRKELAREKRARQKAEEQLEAAQDNTQLEDVRKDLLKEKKTSRKLADENENLQFELSKQKKVAARAAQRGDEDVEADTQAEQLRQELAKEKKERAKAEAAVQKVAEQFEAQKATLEEKLGQFRTKLKTTKEKLKETETELATARTAISAAQALETAKTARAPRPTAKESKKRNAAHFDPDATNLGTPGDGPAAKRGRHNAVGFGDKSTFSITPFLNRTIGVTSERMETETERLDMDDSPMPASPTVEETVTLPKQVLATVSLNASNILKKANARQPKQKPAPPVLEMVTEESTEDVHSQGQENAAGARQAKSQGIKIKTKTADGPADTDTAPAKGKKKPKMRKSLSEFTTFTSEPEPEKKKKRKLGGVGKTLFDEEEESAAPAKGLTASRGLFGTKGFGGFGPSAAKKAGSLLGASSKLGSTFLTATDGSGFQFSPLKRSRKNLDDTLRG